MRITLGFTLFCQYRQPKYYAFASVISTKSTETKFPHRTMWTRRILSMESLLVSLTVELGLIYILLSYINNDLIIRAKYLII